MNEENKEEKKEASEVEALKKSHEHLKSVAFWVIIAGTAIFTGIFLALNIYLLWFDTTIARDVISQHYAATLGLPLAAIASLVLVILLEASSGPIEFKGLGFEFKGTSGQVVLWVFVFLSMAMAVKLLW